MNTSIIPDNSFDPIALKIRLQEDYDKFLKEQEFCNNYQPHITFEEGKYDGALDIEPRPYQWFSSATEKAI